MPRWPVEPSTDRPTSKPPDWLAAHVRAGQTPATTAERAIIQQLAALWDFVRLFGEDGLLREHVAGILTNVEGLLNGDFGRLDRGLISGYLYELAERMDFDLDTETFR